MVNAFQRMFGRWPGSEARRVAARADAETRARASRAPSAPPLAPLPGPHGATLRWWRIGGPFGPLRLGDESATYAEIRRRGWRGWYARTAGATWSLEGTWGVLPVARDGDSQPMLTFRASPWFGGRVERPAGEVLRWRPVGLGAGWRLETEDGRGWIECAAEGFLRRRVAIQLHEVVRGAPDRDALVLLTGALPEISRRRRVR